MTKKIQDTLMDGYLTSCQGTEFFITEAAPANRAAAVSAALTATTVTGSYTISDAAPDGRQSTFPAQADVAITASGTANWLSTGDGANLLVTTSVTPQVLDVGGGSNTVDVPAWNQIIRDAT